MKYDWHLGKMCIPYRGASPCYRNRSCGMEGPVPGRHIKYVTGAGFQLRTQKIWKGKVWGKVVPPFSDPSAVRIL